MDEQKIKQAFKKSSEVSRLGLSESIWNTIVFRIERRRQVMVWVYRSITIISAITLIPALRSLSAEIASSGFFEYLSLVFSQSALATSFKELAIVLAETAPIMSGLVCLALVLALTGSLRGILKNSVRTLQAA